MADVIGFVPASAKIDETVIARLEEGLAAARAGNIKAVAIAYVAQDGSTWCSWSASDKFIEQIGAVERLRHRLHIRQDEA